MAMQETSSYSSPDRSLSRYIQATRIYPMLSPEEETKLARRWRRHKDRTAVDKLVTSHLRLVVKTAMGYRGYGQPISDLIAAGNVGLMRAVERFEQHRSVRRTISSDGSLFDCGYTRKEGAFGEKLGERTRRCCYLHQPWA